MVVDASALVTILLRESEWDLFLDAIVKAEGGVISPVNAWETYIRTSHLRDESGRPDAERLVGQLGVEIVPIDAQQTQIAVNARLRFGRGTLNMGDCFAYALAKTHGGGALLYKGDDFARTDIVSALAAPAP